MPTIPIFQVMQRSEDGAIFVNHSFPSPLIALDLLATVQRNLVMDAMQKMELKKESAIITGEQGKALIT